MNIFNIHVRKFVGDAPAQPYLSQETMRLYEVSQGVMGQVRQRAAKLLWDTRRKRTTVLTQTNEAASRYYQGVVEQLAAQKNAAIAAATQETIQWLCEAHTIEQIVFNRLLKRAETWLLHVLEQFSQSIDWKPQLIRDVEAALTSFDSDTLLKLSVSSEDASTLQGHFSGTPTVLIDVSEAMEPGTALLTAPLVKMTINSAAQMTTLIESLKQFPVFQPE